MKTLLLLAFLIMTATVQAKPCWQKVVSAQQALGNKPNVVLAKHLCVWIVSPKMVKRAVIIMKLESDFRNIISPNGEDFGFFQFHKSTIKSYGLDRRYLMKNWFYQFDSFELVMKDKLRACKKLQVPEACWHSGTKKHYARYSALYIAAEIKLLGVL